jgi:hypothetical protein
MLSDTKITVSATVEYHLDEDRLQQERQNHFQGACTNSLDKIGRRRLNHMGDRSQRCMRVIPGLLLNKLPGFKVLVSVLFQMP